MASQFKCLVQERGQYIVGLIGIQLKLDSQLREIIHICMDQLDINTFSSNNLSMRVLETVFLPGRKNFSMTISSPQYQPINLMQTDHVNISITNQFGRLLELTSDPILLLHFKEA